MAKLGKLKPGQTLWTVSKGRMGNTMLRTVSVHPVVVKEVHAEDGYVIASWNYNSPSRYFRGEVERWKLQEPVLIRSTMLGQARLATKEEKAAILAKRNESHKEP